MNALKFSLLLFLCLMIQSCAGPQTKRTSERLPPEIKCEERKQTDEVPAPPASTDWREWASAYVAALGWGEQAEKYRAATADCLDEHRKAKDIR